MKKGLSNTNLKREEVIENIIRKKRNKKVIIVVGLIVLIGLIIGLVLGFGFYYFGATETQLKLGAEIERVVLSEDGEMLFVKLSGGSIDKEIVGVKFVFIDADGNECVYETSEGVSEINVSYEVSFWDFFNGVNYEGVYDYEISLDDVECLDSFDGVVEVWVVFSYKEEGVVVDSPVLDTERPAPVLNVSFGGSSGGSSGGGGGGDDGGCVPQTCFELGFECGIQIDNCGDNIDCGGCGDDEGDVYYLDAVNGDDENDGKLVEDGGTGPWQTIDRAAPQASYSPNVVSGDTVILRGGYYGAIDGTGDWDNDNTDWITYIAEDATGDPPLFQQIILSRSPNIETYLIFDGIRFPWVVDEEGEVGVDRTYGQAVHIYGANHFKLLNCYIEGNVDLTNGIEGGKGGVGFYARSRTGEIATEFLQDILIDNCEITKLSSGITITDVGDPNGLENNGIIIRNSKIHHLYNDAVQAHSLSNSLFENNTIGDAQIFGNVMLADGGSTSAGNFEIGDTFTQDSTGATGIFLYLDSDPTVYNVKGSYGIWDTTEIISSSGGTFTPSGITPQAQHSDLIQIYGDGDHDQNVNVTIRGNLFYDSFQMVFLKEMTDALIENNLFYGWVGSEHVISLTSGAFSGTIRNNTIVIGNTQINIKSNTIGGEVFNIYNNLLTASLSYGPDVGETVNTANNIIGTYSSYDAGTIDETTNSLYGHYLTAEELDSLFVDYSGGNFSPLMSSIACNGEVSGSHFLDTGSYIGSLACVDKLCPGGVADCDDRNLCTDEICNEGICEYSFNTNPCDIYGCTEDVCSNGVCQAGTPDNALCLIGFSGCTDAVCNPSLYPETGCGGYIPVGCGVFSHWKFDTENLGVTPDETGNNDGILSGATIVSDAERGNVLSLDGEEDYVDMGDVEINGAITITAWINRKGSDGKIILDKHMLEIAGKYYNYGLEIRSNTLWFEYGNGTADDKVSSVTQNWVDDQWYFVTVTYDGINTIKLYRNDTLLLTDTGGIGPIANDDTTLWVGKRRTSTYNYWNGSIDEVMIYNRALSSSEVEEIYCGQGGEGEFCEGYIGSLSLWTRIKDLFSTSSVTGNVVLGSSGIGDSSIDLIGFREEIKEVGEYLLNDLLGVDVSIKSIHVGYVIKDSGDEKELVIEYK